MITKEHMSIYERYKGDIDGFARAGSKSEKQIFTDRDWHDISELLDRLYSERHVVVAESFKAATVKLLHERVIDESTIKILKEYEA